MCVRAYVYIHIYIYYTLIVETRYFMLLSASLGDDPKPWNGRPRGPASLA